MFSVAILLINKRHTNTSPEVVATRTEHHRNIQEKSYVNLESYTIGAQFCRTTCVRGGVIIYVHNTLKFANIDLTEYCKEKDIEISAVRLNINLLPLCILTIYRAPSGGNFAYFLQNVDSVLKTLYTPSIHVVICGDLNINCLVENEQKRHFDNLLLMYNLTGIVDFPTRISHTSATAIDNFIIDISCFEDYSVIPLANDISDHDVQILTIKTLVQNQSDRLKTIRKVDKHTINEFIYALSNESWDNVFNNNDVNVMFNSFLNTFLRIFHSSFPLIRTKIRNYKFNWITIAIKTSCKRKRELFILLRNSNNLALKQ